ncbi:MAG: DUF4421 domain-containing protein [Muribaculaceae bacterium]|nr:DUF4421 domain-containing protein [Muribaculaceae bacterium]
MSRRIKIPRHKLFSGYLTLLLSVVSIFTFPAEANPNKALIFSHTPILGESSIAVYGASSSESSQLPDLESGMDEIDDDDRIFDRSMFEEGGLVGKPTRRPEANDSNRNWWYLLRHGKLNTADTTVQYPKFLNFCMKVYRWADKAFNSYDTTYVVGTGRRWKVRLLSDNWVDSYYINPGKKLPIRMMSDPYANLGAYIQYMAVSVGYSVDINNLLWKNSAKHQKIEYTFNCARFNVEGHIWRNKGGSYIRTFGDYNNGHLTKHFFEGVSLNDFEIYGYYFFNNRKFSMGASYNFSKFQKKSAGSAVIGIGYNNIDVGMNLTKLPEELLPYLNIDPENLKFHYRSYSIISGYSFNWVLNKRLLFNISAFPGMGINITYEDSHAGSAKSLAMNIRAMSSLTYNLKDFFICAVGKLDGNWYISGKNSLFSSVENAQLSVGYRF